MTCRLNVYALPSLVEPKELVGGTVVVIDVLRASTTIAYALDAGAVEVIPCQEVEDARAVAGQFPGGEAVLGGERKGLPIDGFHLGNSPVDYVPGRVQGKTIVFTTSNGTRAMHRARLAERILIGSFANATAIAQELLGLEQIHLMCAGTGGQIGRDDVLLAGMLAERIVRRGGLIYEENAQSITARETWLHAFALPKSLGGEPLEPELLARELCKSPGGRNLSAIGLEADILAAAQIDQFNSVPELDPEKQRIRLV